MPILGAMFVALAERLFGFLVKFTTQKIAFGAAAVAALGVLVVALVAVLSAGVAAVVGAFPAMALTGVWVMVPDNAVAVLAWIFTVDGAVALYAWNRGNVRLMATVS